MELPLPSTIAVSLALKIGEPYGNSRSNYGSPLAMELTVEDGYLGFYARVKRKIDTMKEIIWHEDSPILIKPTTSAPQSKCQPLAQTDGELAVLLAAMWQLAARRRSGQASFKLELFVYVAKVGASTGIRRATESRIAAAAALIDQHLESQTETHPESQGGMHQSGAASRAYWAITQARQPEHAPLIVLDNPTFTQLRAIDAHQREIDASASAASRTPEFVSIRCRLNGGLIPLDLNVADLREALGLSAYDLRPPYRAPVEGTAAPAVNIADVDHLGTPDINVE